MARTELRLFAMISGAILLLAPVLAGAQMYKCTDERGKTIYADKPCPGAKGGQVDIQGQAPISGKLQAPGENLQREEADFRRRQAARERADEKDRAALQRRCAALRREYALLSNGRRIVQVDARGQRTVVEDQTRDKRLAVVSEQLRACP